MPQDLIEHNGEWYKPIGAGMINVCSHGLHVCNQEYFPYRYKKYEQNKYGVWRKTKIVKGRLAEIKK